MNNMSNNGLSKLIEECGELLEVCGKKLARPHTNIHFDGRNLKEMMEKEMADVQAAITFVSEKLDLDAMSIIGRTQTKLNTFRYWDEGGTELTMPIEHRWLCGKCEQVKNGIKPELEYHSRHCPKRYEIPIPALTEAEHRREVIGDWEIVPDKTVQPSVQPDWCKSLTIQQQSVLFLAGRGPDGIAKDNPCKKLHQVYRATVLNAAKYGRQIRPNDDQCSFMSIRPIFDNIAWNLIVKAFFDNVDSLPHHYYMHLMHGAEIIGYKHPDDIIRNRWLSFYYNCVNDLHLETETEIAMDKRLNDWDRKYWENNDRTECPTKDEEV